MNLTEIEKIVLESLNSLIGEKEIDHDSQLLDLGVDSITFIRLVVDLEDKFDFEVDDEDITLDNFATLSKILELLLKYLEKNNA